MNPEQLQAIKERVDKATPGPWIIEESRFGNFNAASENESYDLPACLMNEVDAQFVTNAREDIPALIAEVELQKANAEQYLRDNVELHNENLILNNELQRLNIALDCTELAEVKARMEAEELAKVALDDTYNGFMAKREIEQLRAALEFYANKESYERVENEPDICEAGFSHPTWEPSWIELDKGLLARKALAGDSNAI